MTSPEVGPQSAARARPAWPVRFLAAATAGYATLLVWATHYPKPQNLLGPKPPSDKLLHISAYTLLGGLVAATLLGAGRRSLRTARTAAAGLAAFAAIDEATQPLPWFRRMADPIDWFFDAAGIVIGMTVVWALAATVRAVRGPADRGRG